MTGGEAAAGAEPGDSYTRDDERKASAWRLHNRENKSVAEVASELGVAKSTAHRWIKEGQAAEVYADLLTRQTRRLDMADRLRLYRQWAIVEWQAGGSAGGNNRKAGAGSFRELLPALLQIESLEMRLLGLAMPVEVDHRFVQDNGEAPPPGIVNATLAARERDQEKRRAIEQGEDPYAGA